MTVGLSDRPAGTSAAPPRPESPPSGGGPDYRFGAAMGGVLAVGALVQALFIQAVAARAWVSPEARFDAAQAQWLVRGYWFANPYWLVHRVSFGRGYLAPVPSALHAPLTSTVLAMADEANASSATDQRVLLAVIFLGSALVVGLGVRRLAGPLPGVLSALVVVLYPELWVNPATLPVETLVVAAVALLLWGSVRFWQGPSVRGAAEVGFYLALAALARIDLALLVVLVGLPLMVRAPRAGAGQRLRFLGAMLALVLVVAGPWIGRNLNTFSHTVVLSDDPGYVVGRANCATTYGGPLVGWATGTCPPGATGVREPGTNDESVVAARRQQAGSNYTSDHLDRLPAVLAARLGRLWNVFRPGQQSRLEAGVGRPAWVSSWGWWWFWALVPLAAVGVAVLRRRRALLFPFLALAASASLAALAAYGDARLRVGADVALAALAGVGLAALWSRRRVLPALVSGRAGERRGARRGRHAAARAT